MAFFVVWLPLTRTDHLSFRGSSLSLFSSSIFLQLEPAICIKFDVHHIFFHGPEMRCMCSHFTDSTRLDILHRLHTDSTPLDILHRLHTKWIWIRVWMQCKLQRLNTHHHISFAVGIDLISYLLGSRENSHLRQTDFVWSLYVGMPDICVILAIAFSLIVLSFI